LDFRKIKQNERDAANKLFHSKKGKEIQKEIQKKAKMFVPGANIPDNRPKGKKELK
jgi:U2 small nuclear ribonucleoprotein A'